MQEFSTVVGMLLSGIFVGSPDPSRMLQYISWQDTVKTREIKAFQRKLFIMANEM